MSPQCLLGEGDPGYISIQGGKWWHVCFGPIWTERVVAFDEVTHHDLRGLLANGQFYTMEVWAR